MEDRNLKNKKILYECIQHCGFSLNLHNEHTRFLFVIKMFTRASGFMAGDIQIFCITN